MENGVRMRREKREKEKKGSSNRLLKGTTS